MKNFLLLLLLLPLSIFAQKNFVIAGKVEGLADGSEVKILAMQNNTVVATSTVQNGAFALNGSVPEPGLYFITLGHAQPQHIYLENSKIIVAGSTKDITNLKIEGSRSHKDFEVFKTVFNPLITGLNEAAGAINQAPDERQKNKLMGRYDSIRKVIGKEVTKFVSEKNKSFVSPFLLYVTAQIDDDATQLEKRFNMLDTSIRNSIIGKELSNYITYQKVGQVGSEAMNFTQADVNGQPVSLTSFRGKYVLIDFWASWCKPCRVENPNVVKAYEKFSNKNFTVLGISLDQDKEAWLRAIEKDKLTWTQLSDLKSWNNEVAVLYRVSGIPQNFLVDPNGKIVAKNLRGEELEAKLCEILGCN